jgi:hypothetical protein
MSIVDGTLRAEYEHDVTVIEWKFCENGELGNAKQSA